jgi:hypothetical protein
VNRVAATVASAALAIQVPLTVYFRAVVEPVPLAIGTLDEVVRVLVDVLAIDVLNALVSRLKRAVPVSDTVNNAARLAIAANHHRDVSISGHGQMLSCAELLLDFSANSYNEFMP